MTPTKATDDSHDNGSCYHAAGDPCPAERGDDYPRQKQATEQPVEYPSVSDYCTCSLCVLLRNQRDRPEPTTGDRGADSSGQLDGHGLAALRQILLDTLDRKVWLLYEKRAAGVVLWKEWQADQERLDFCDAVAKAIIDAATPATRQPAVTAGRVK